MKNKYTAVISLIIILVLIAYIINDTSAPDRPAKKDSIANILSLTEDKWQLNDTVKSIYGKLKAVSVSINGDIVLGGSSFIAYYLTDLKPVWNVLTENPVTSLTISGDTIFASAAQTIMLINLQGKKINEWGPYEDSCLITSISSNKHYVAAGDAGNKIVFILKKTGELQTIIGHTGKKFIIPSPYFDVALTADNKLMVANTGERRIETRTLDGEVISFFGEPGIAPEAFCGCCNPAHFSLLPEGIITAEKGINRIKIINKKGEFVEFVSSRNNFLASVPLDIASFSDNVIYAANPVDSRLYIYKKKVK